MTPFLVDSNVIIDVITEDARFLDWSANAMAESAQFGVLLTNRAPLEPSNRGLMDPLKGVDFPVSDG